MPKPKVIITPEDEFQICKEYQETNNGTEVIAAKFHIGKKRVCEILDKHNIERKGRGKQPLRDEFIVSDWKIQKYPELEGQHYMVVDDNTGFASRDINNKGGALTTYIEKQYGIETPTIYDRRLYYMRTGNYWWEQWLRVEVVDNPELKHCPYCNWTTIDVTNRSGWFEQHLREAHGISKFDYIKEHPEEKEYFTLVHTMLNRQMSDNPEEYVICKECGMKVARIGTWHLRTHNMSLEDYIQKHGDMDLHSIEYQTRAKEYGRINNMYVKTETLNKFTSKAEEDIRQYLQNITGFECEKNRKVLSGREIDILIPEIKIGIEYCGNKWHSELFGHKSPTFHLEKHTLAKSAGINLITIFEDEYIKDPEGLKLRLSNTLGLYDPNIKGNIDDWSVTMIQNNMVDSFCKSQNYDFDPNYIISFGIFDGNSLIAVMTLQQFGDSDWKISDMVFDWHYPEEEIVKRFTDKFFQLFNGASVTIDVDRRWVINEEDNIWTRLGFKFKEYTDPRCYYLSERLWRGLRKKHTDINTLLKGRITSLTTNEEKDGMIKNLGYDRIWDCGAIRYVWKK